MRGKRSAEAGPREGGPAALTRRGWRRLTRTQPGVRRPHLGSSPRPLPRGGGGTRGRGGAGRACAVRGGEPGGEDVRHALLLGNAHPGKPEAVGPPGPVTPRFRFPACAAGPGGRRSSPRRSCSHGCTSFADSFLSRPALARFLSPAVTPLPASPSHGSSPLSPA